MKFSGAFSTLLVILPFFVLQAAAAPGAVEARAGRARGGRFGGFRGGKQGGNQNAKGGNQNAKGGNNGAAAGGAAASSAAASSAAAAATNTAAAGANNANNAAAAAGGAAAAGAAAGGNEQTSLTLDPSLIGANLAQDGLGANGTEAGQVASLTSTNNFINFCAGKTITNGLQIQGGSCNPVPMGDLPGTNNQPAAKFQFPVNMQNIGANTDFTIKMAIQNLDTGFFVNPNTNYFGAPQQLVNGVIQGHSHVVVQAINGVLDTNPADPTVFAFFKGLNAAAQGGVLTADVAKGLPEGTYRLFSINTAANHQPAVGPVAQHGSFDDAVYFTVGANAASQAAQDIASVSGQAAAAAGTAAAGGAAAAATNAAATNAAAGAAATGAAANNAGAAAGAAAAGAAAGQNGAKGAAAAGQNGAKGAAAAAGQNGAKGAAAAAGQNGAKGAAASAGQNGAKGAAAQGAAQNGKNGAAAAAAQKGQQANKAQGKAFGSFGQQKGKNGRRSYSREQS